MNTTLDYINQLKEDKKNLANTLNEMGVEASENETFTSLTPKVRKIVTDPILQDKSITITENGTTNIVADEGYNGLNNVEIITNVASTGSKTNLFIQENEPEEKDGIWFKKNDLTYDTIEFAENDTLYCEKSAQLTYAVRECTIGSVGDDIYIFGGMFSGGSVYNRAYKFNTKTDQITTIANLPYTAYGVAAATYGTDIYLFGGRNGGSVYNYAYKYDTLTNAYTKLTNLPYTIGQAGATRVGTDIYIFGGTASSGQSANAYKYDILTNSYTKLTSLPFVRNTPTATSKGTDIYIFGGFNGSDGINQALKYDTLTNTYTTLKELPYGAFGMGAITVNNQVYVMGGTNLNTQTFNELYLYDTLNNIYIRKGTLYCPAGRIQESVAYANNSIYIIGGTATPLASLATTEKPEFLGYAQRCLIDSVFNDYTNTNDTVIIQGSKNDNNIKLTDKIKCKVLNVSYYSVENGLDHSIPTYIGDGIKWIKL